MTIQSQEIESPF